MMLSLAFALLQDAGHLASYVQPSGRMLDGRTFGDYDGDGDLDLFQAVLGADGKRYIDVHMQKEGRAFSAAPDLHLEMSSAVVAWNIGDFLDGEGEEGVEILMLASRGAYIRSHGGRPQRLTQDRVSMLLDMPSSQSLPLWDAVADIDADGRPEVALVLGTGYRIVDHDGTTLGEIEHEVNEERAPVASGNYLGGLIRTTISSQELGTLFVPNEDLGVIARPPALFSATYLPNPVWADVNGDGRLDLTFLVDHELSLHIQAEDGSFAGEASQVIELPQSEESDYEEVAWMDFGGGPAADLLFVRSSADFLSQTRPWQIRTYLDPALREDIEESDGFLKIQGTFLWVYAFDLDGNGEKDLCLSNWKLDLGMLGTNAPQVVHDISGFLSEDGVWGTRPAFVWSETYKVEDFDSFITVDAFVADMTGDQLPDFVERSKTGNLEVRRFVGRPGHVTVEDQLNAEIPINALQAAVQTKDLNADGIGDFIIQRDGNLEVHLSFRR